MIKNTNSSNPDARIESIHILYEKSVNRWTDACELVKQKLSIQQKASVQDYECVLENIFASSLPCKVEINLYSYNESLGPIISQ